jgi:hypothetical protein
MATTRIDLHNRNLGRILKGEEGTLAADLNRRGARVAARAGWGYSSEGFKGRARYRTTVHSDHIVRLDKCPLLRSLDAAKGGA